MKKNIWILNHYATDMYFNEGGRHYWIGKELKRQGYNPIIFCSSTRHGHKEDILLDNKLYMINEEKQVPFIFINSTPYVNNDIRRVLNMYSFYRNIIKTAKKITEKIEKPDFIYASSVHPLTLLAGIKIAKIFNIPCISEVRDLWPESIIAYGILKRTNPIAKVLYSGEKYIYKKSDRIIMTWEGGKDYILEQGWDNVINLNKIYHINNGVDIEQFNYNMLNYTIDDLDLENNKNIIYTGSIRKVNNLDIIVEVARLIEKEDNDIQFLIYGDGDERKKLIEKCKKENIKNIKFKGKVDKKYIPYILSKSYLNLLHNTSTSLDKYGQSQNKFFEYLASGRPIIQTYKTGYSINDKFKTGINIDIQNPENIAFKILDLMNNELEVEDMAVNTKVAVKECDFKKLTSDFINIIKEI